MARKKDDGFSDPAPMTFEEWEAQEACPECGSRPGYNPITGVEIKDGHTYICSKRPK